MALEVVYKNDADNMEFLIETCDLAETFTDTAFGIKQAFFSSKDDPPAGAFAPAPATTPPSPILAGAVKRSRERDQLFLRSKSITQAAKEALDLIGEESTPPNLGAFQPTISVTPSQNNYEYAVVVSNRGESNSFRVEYKTKGGNWTSAGTFTGKSVDLTYAPPTPGDPHVLDIRVILLKNNEPYGQPSDTKTITVNP